MGKWIVYRDTATGRELYAFELLPDTAENEETGILSIGEVASREGIPWYRIMMRTEERTKKNNDRKMDNL